MLKRHYYRISISLTYKALYQERRTKKFRELKYRYLKELHHFLIANQDQNPNLPKQTYWSELISTTCWELATLESDIDYNNSRIHDLKNSITYRASLG